jgi:proton-dependent oligopeptide transporter, POT family
MSEVKQSHPKGLYVLFVTEMWERFSYYGMRAIFVLFLTKALMYDKAFGSDIYGSYTGLVYLTPLIGGYMADRYWGNRKSIIIGGIMMAIGQFFMFMSGSFYQNIDVARILMLVGLTSLIVGNGFFKPNISTMVGQLYPKGDKRIDSAFTIFYMGINLGAFFAPLVCGFLGDTGHPGDFKWGFLAAGIGMIMSLILFITLKDKYIVTPDGEPIGMKPNSKRETADIDTIAEASSEFSKAQIFTWLTVEVVLFSLFYLLGQGIIGSFIFSFSVAAPGFIISDKSLTKIEKERIWVIFIVAFFVIFFWAAFEQAGAALTFFAEEQTNRTLFGKEIPASYFQSINAVAIVIFASLFVALWGFLSKRGKEPASPYKQSIGLFLLAIGYLVIAFGVKGIAPSTKVSMVWLVSLYMIHTFGELCLSPIGLSMVNKLAPVKFASLLMGVWFLSTASANKFAGTLSSFYPETMVTVAAVESQQTANAITLCSKMDKAEDINGTKYISIDLVSFAEVKTKDAKAIIVENIFKDSLIKKKSFLGYTIDSLYSFFMLFVVMAGIASVILFFLSKKLITMMNGVR